METAYEAVYIIDPTTAEEQANAIVEKYSGVVTKANGIIDDIDRMEPRRLAYEIKGRREGLYVVMNFRSEPAAKDELDRIFRISDDVLRHLIVKQDKRADRFPSKSRAAENERREREYAARSTTQSEAQSVTDLGAVQQPAAAPAPAEEPAPAAESAPAAAEETPATEAAAE